MTFCCSLYDNYKAVTNGAQVDEHLFGWPVRKYTLHATASVFYRYTTFS